MIERELSHDQYKQERDTYKKYAERMDQQRSTTQHLIKLTPGCHYQLPNTENVSQLAPGYHLGYVAASEDPAARLKKLGKKAKKALFIATFNLIHPLLTQPEKQSVSTQADSTDFSDHANKKPKIARQTT